MNESTGKRMDVTLRVSETGRSSGDSVFDQVGGSATFDVLVTKFYEGVRGDELLWPMYPQDDLEGAIRRLSMFLQQYWGGPATYSEERGHPRLRMRHAAFRVNPAARDRWLHHMLAALDSIGLPPLHDAAMRDYIDRAAHSLVNTFGE